MTVNSVQLYGSILHASKSTEFQRESGFVLNVERYEQNNRSLKVVKKNTIIHAYLTARLLYTIVSCKYTPPFATLALVQSAGRAYTWDATFSLMIMPFLPVPHPQLRVQKTTHLTTLQLLFGRMYLYKLSVNFGYSHIWLGGRLCTG